MFLSRRKMDPYQERVVKMNKEIERVLFVNLALEAEVQSVQKRLEMVRKDRELLLGKVRSHEAMNVESSKPPAEVSGKRSMIVDSKVEKIVNKKRKSKKV